MKHALFTTLLILLAIITTNNAQLTVMNRKHEIQVFEIVPVKFYNSTRGEFYVRDFFFNGSVSLDETDLNGQFYVRKYYYGIDEKMREIQESGVLAVIMGTTSTNYPGRSRYQLSEPRTPVDGIVVQISNDDLDIVNEMIENDEILWVTLQGNNSIVNLYDQPMLNIGTFTQVVLGLFFGCILVLCIYLFIFEIQGEAQDTIAKHRLVLLVSLIVANAFRFGFVLYDPFSYQGLSAWPVNSFIHIFNIPFSILSEMIVSLLWFKTLHLTLLRNNRFLIMMRLPFIIASSIFCIFLFATVMITIASPRFMESLVTLAAIIYVLSLVILTVYHLVVSFIFFRQVDKIKKKAAKKKNNKSFIVKVIMMSFTDILMMVFIVGIFVPITETTTLLNLFFLLASSGLHSCTILTLFSWRAGETSSSTTDLSLKSKNTSVSKQ